MALERWDIRKIEGKVKRRIHSRAKDKGIDIPEEIAYLLESTEELERLKKLEIVEKAEGK
jgi:hypothetical protein